jgi:hypothetical protein
MDPRAILKLAFVSGLSQRLAEAKAEKIPATTKDKSSMETITSINERPLLVSMNLQNPLWASSAGDTPGLSNMECGGASAFVSNGLSAKRSSAAGNS